MRAATRPETVAKGEGVLSRRMKIGILGPLTITDDVGASLAIRLEPKQEIVLVALAANADRGVPLRELVLAVYGTAEVALYKRSVESLVSRLRSSLRTNRRDNPVVPPARGGFYTLGIPEKNVDALRFLRQAEHLLNSWHAVPSKDRQALSGRAISEWRADPSRIYGGASPTAPDLFRRFTSTLAELGDRYCRLLLQEQRFDQARRELSRLVELLPGYPPFLQLQEETASRQIEATPGRRVADPTSAIGELRDRIVASRPLPLDAVTVTAHNLDRIYLASIHRFVRGRAARVSA